MTKGSKNNEKVTDKEIDDKEVSSRQESQRKPKQQNDDDDSTMVQSEANYKETTGLEVPASDTSSRLDRIKCLKNEKNYMRLEQAMNQMKRELVARIIALEEKRGINTVETVNERDFKNRTIQEDDEEKNLNEQNDAMFREDDGDNEANTVSEVDFQNCTIQENDEVIETIAERTWNEQSSDNGDNDENQEGTQYPTDSYSLLAVHGLHKNWRIVFLSTGVFLAQFSLLLLLVLSIMYEPWHSAEIIDGLDPIFPGDVEPIVKIVQLISIVIHVIFPDYGMEELITAVKLFPNLLKLPINANLEGRLSASPFSRFKRVIWYVRNDAHFFGYMLSYILRFLQGLLSNVATFFLIFTSVTAKDVVLNFAAINFISGIDETAFASVLKGRFGQKMKKKALQVKKKQLPEYVTDKRHPLLRTYVLTFFTLIAMCTFAFAFVLVPQMSGEFLVEQYRLDFGTGSELEKYNGCYNKDGAWRFGIDRPVYYQQESDETKIKAKFAYCKKERKWYFFKGDDEDACNENQMLAYSSLSSSYDIERVFQDPWYLRGGAGLEVSSEFGGIGIGGGCGITKGDGKCNVDFNTADFEYDGGDCCAATCNQPICGLGVLKQAFETTLNADGDGYQNCLNPVMVDVKMILHEVKVESYRQTECPFQMVYSTPPLLRVECDGRNHLTIDVEEKMENKTELIKVEDDAKCKVLIRSGHKVSFTIVHSMMLNDITPVETNVLSQQVINNWESQESYNVEFQLIPKCYFAQLYEYVKVSSIYIGETTSQRKAIDWLLSGLLTETDSSGFSDCSNPFFMERYALAAVYFSMMNKDAGLPDIMKRQEAQCSWPFVTCSGGNVVRLRLVGEEGFSLGTIPTELVLLPRLKELDLGM